VDDTRSSWLEVEIRSACRMRDVSPANFWFCRYKGFPNSQAKLGQDDSELESSKIAWAHPSGASCTAAVRDEHKVRTGETTNNGMNAPTRNGIDVNTKGLPTFG